MLMGKIKKCIEEIEIKLEKLGIKTPVIKFAIPPELVRIAQKYSNPEPEKAINEIAHSEWVKGFCASRCLPDEYKHATIEDLERAVEKGELDVYVLKAYNTCRHNLAKSIVEKYGMR